MTENQQKTLIAYPTYAKFLEDYEPKQLMVTYVNINTITKSVAVQQPRLTLEDLYIVYTAGKFDAGVDYIRRWLDYLNKFSNLSKLLTETQAVAYKIYNAYKYFYLTDLNLIFDKLMNCEYGIFYGSVDAPRILGAFMAYSHERNATLANVRNHIKSELTAYISPMETAEWKAIQKRVSAQYTDKQQIYVESKKIFDVESFPKLKKLHDEMETSLYKKYLE